MVKQMYKCDSCNKNFGDLQAIKKHKTWGPKKQRRCVLHKNSTEDELDKHIAQYCKVAGTGQRATAAELDAQGEEQVKVLATLDEPEEVAKQLYTSGPPQLAGFGNSICRAELPSTVDPQLGPEEDDLCAEEVDVTIEVHEDGSLQLAVKPILETKITLLGVLGDFHKLPASFLR